MSNTNSESKSYKDYIHALEHRSAIDILIKLCDQDEKLSERILKMAKTSLAKVSADEVAEQVFRSLNAIQIEDLWDNSGKTRWGYQEPTEVAFEMIDDVIRDYTREMKQYSSLDMKKEEKEYFKGIISGLLRYGAEGNNDFYDAVPDEPYTIAENILYDWKKTHSEEDIAEVQAVYDDYFTEDDEPEHFMFEE